MNPQRRTEVMREELRAPGVQSRFNAWVRVFNGGILAALAGGACLLAGVLLSRMPLKISGGIVTLLGAAASCIAWFSMHKIGKAATNRFLERVAPVRFTTDDN